MSDKLIDFDGLSEAKGRDPYAALREELRRKYGDPYITKKNPATGKLFIADIRTRYWAALIGRELPAIWSPADACFWGYDSATGLFSRVSVERLREIAAERLFTAADVEREPKVKEFVTLPRLKQISDLAKGIHEDRGFFDEAPEALHVANGAIVRTEDGIAMDGTFSPEYRARNRSPFEYDPDATCPRFLKELLEPMLPPDDIDLLQRWLGLALAGDNIAQKILLLDGSPGRGKGVLQRIIKELVGALNCTELRTQHLGERFEMNRFVGKSLLVGSDVPGTFLESKWASNLKALVGGDLLTVEAKGSNEAANIEGRFNVLVVSNTRLRCRLDGDVGAWRRRLAILRTDAPPPAKKIPNFERILLRDEGAGILRWAVDGYVRAMEELDADGDLSMSEEQRKRVDDLLSESESLEIFVRDGIRKAEGHDLTVEEIEAAFADFCADRGWTPPSVSRIHAQLPDLMLRTHGTGRANSIKRDGRAKRGFRNVRLREGE